MTSTIANMKNTSYICDTTWSIKLKRFQVPFAGVIGFLPLTDHVVTPRLTGTLKSVQKSATDRQKAKVSATSYRQQNPVNDFAVSNWSLILERVNAKCMPLQDGDVKRYLGIKFRVSLIIDFSPISKYQGKTALYPQANNN